MNQSERRQYLIRSLLNENPAYHDWGVPQDADDQKRLLRGLMNVRPAQNSGAEFLKIQDEYLREVTAQKGVTDADSLSLVQQRLYEKQTFFTLVHSQILFSITCLGQVSAHRPQWRQWCWSITTGFCVMSMHFCGQTE